MKKYILSVIVSSSLIFSSCIDKLGHTVEDFDVCKKRWITNNADASIASAEIINGNLVLTAPSLKVGTNLELSSQDTIAGDFEAIVKFENFSVGLSYDSNSAFFQMYTTSIINHKLTSVAQVKVNSTGGIFNDSISNSKTYNNDSTFLSGTLKIARSGAIVTILTIVNSISPIDGSTIQNVSTSINNNFGNDNLKIGFKLGAEKNELKPITTIINEFTIAKGGEKVISDSFNCNSLK